MPVLESTEEITPRSALRHRPIGDSTSPSSKRRTTGSEPVAKRASRPITPEMTDDIVEWLRGDEHEVLTKVKPRASTKQITTKTKVQPPRKGVGRLIWRAHPLLYLGGGMLTMIVVWTILSAVFNWLIITVDDVRYGRPRTFHIEAWVGHEQSGRPSHFIAVNLNRQIQIIEMPGGEAARARIYVGPQLYGNGDELVPITLSFADVNSDHKPDMIIHFQESRVIFINDKDNFRPLQPAERQQVERFLQEQQI